ncbi:hypothetical protein JTB14_022875 [Gonioctena quinquepunctata]|nr:hypothetical protein JTB14_022875 [Gonioctena quinquepunctata]
MADWRINEKYRKPRRAKGTPLFVLRNYYALGGLAFGGISWYLYELWPESQKLRRAQLEGKFDYPEGYQQKLEKKRYKKMKKNRPNNHGLQKSSILNQTSKNRASSSIRSHSPKENSESFDSPYKNSLSEIKQIASNNDEADDFRTPIPFKKTSKTVSKNKAVPKKSGRKFQRKLTSLLQKQTEDNLKNLDVNPDHLQMALALSKSTLAEENPEEFRKSQEQDLPVFLSPEKIPKGGTVLERFGFKSSKLRLHAEFREDNYEDLRSRKYSKFRFVTPTLHTRTDEERESLVTAKISLIISEKKQSILENSYEFQEIITSSLLEEYHCKENHILNINKIASSELKLFCYYCSSLKIPQNESTYGCLLKKWNEIPGREKSPERILRTVNRDEFTGRDSVTNSSAKLEKNLTNIETLSEKNLLNIESEVIPKNNCPVAILDTDSEDSVNVESDSKAIAKHNTPIVILDTQSEDTVIERAKTPENLNRLSPSLLNLSPSKSPGLLRTSLRSEERFSKNLSIVFNDDNGIEYFESFDTDSESLSKKVLGLKESEEIKFPDPPEDAGHIDLTQSSSSNDNCFLDIDNTESDAATPDENKVPNDPCTFQQTYQSTFEMSPLVLKNSEEKGLESDEEFLDLTQKSPSHEKNISDEIARFDPIIDEIADLNEKQEHIPIIEDISLYKYFTESFEKSRRISRTQSKVVHQRRRIL